MDEPAQKSLDCSFTELTIGPDFLVDGVRPLTSDELRLVVVAGTDRGSKFGMLLSVEAGDVSNLGGVFERLQTAAVTPSSRQNDVTEHQQRRQQAPKPVHRIALCGETERFGGLSQIRFWNDVQ